MYREINQVINYHLLIMLSAYMPALLQNLTFKFPSDGDFLADVPLMKNHEKHSATELIATHIVEENTTFQEYLLTLHSGGSIICDCSIFRQLFVIAKNESKTDRFLLYIGDKLGHCINADKDTFYLRPRNSEIYQLFLAPFNHKGV
jgi:hypothetical protein